MNPNVFIKVSSAHALHSSVSTPAFSPTTASRTITSNALTSKPPLTAPAIGKSPSGAYSPKSFINKEFIDYSRPSTSYMSHQPTMMALVKSSNLEPAIVNQRTIEPLQM